MLKTWWLAARRRPLVMEIAFSVGLAALVLVVHDVGYMLHASYWNDEVWVAISLKAPLHDVPDVIASTPIGWDLLLRIMPLSHPQAARMVPLAFSGATVLAAYWYARLLPWRSARWARLGAVAAAVVALLSPAALVRNDLKQYSCDAFCVLVILTLAAWAERRPGWRSLGVLVAVGSALFVFANPAGLAVGAALASLGLVALLRREWSRLLQVAAATVAALAALGAIYVAFYAHGNIDGLRQYWATNFLPVSDGPAAMWHWFWGLAPTWFESIGAGPVLVAVPLLILAVVAIIRMGLPATAVMVPMLLVEMVTLSALEQYPLFDERTMTFLAIAYGVTVVVGLVYWIQRIRPEPVALVVTLCSIIAIAVWHGQEIRQRSIPDQPSRQDVAAIRDGYRPGDVILARVNSTWAIAYYWGGPVKIVPSTHTQQKFRSYPLDAPTITDLCPERPDGSGDLVIRPACRTPEQIKVALTKAAESAGPDHRVWFYNMQASAVDNDTVHSWADAHGYEFTRPDPLNGTTLTLLVPPQATPVTPS